MTGLKHDLAPYLEDVSNELTAKDILLQYLTPEDFTGAVFDTYGGDRSDPMTISPDDLLAVTMLSIDIRLNSQSGISTRSVLEIADRRGAISRLLHELGPDQELHRLTGEEFEQRIGRADSPANRLYWLLRDEEGCRLPRVATYKLLGRKRPHLLPIRDTVLENALFRGDNWWRAWWEELTDRPELIERLGQIRVQAGPAVSHLSLLRIADILVWMRVRGSAAES